MSLLNTAPPKVGARIALARRAADLNQSELASAIGVSRGAVSQWESGTTEPSAANLRAVAMQTTVKYEWLATGRGDPFDALTIKRVDDAPGLYVRGYVEKGAYRAIPAEPALLQRAPLAPDPRHPRVAQFAWLVQDESAEFADIDFGMYVVGALYDDFVKNYGRVRDRSLVIMERIRLPQNEAELTICRLIESPSMLHIYDPDPNSKERAVSFFHEEESSKEMVVEGQRQQFRIAAVVLAAQRIFSV